jgi:hypothetical protein
VADAVQLCNEIDHPAVGVLVDTYHANIGEKSIAMAIHVASPRLKHVHSSESDRGTPARGGVHWQEFFKAVRAAGYDKWLTIEGFGFSLGALSAAASIWRDLATSPDDVALHGAAFCETSLHCRAIKPGLSETGTRITIYGILRLFNKRISMYANDMLTKNPEVFQVKQLSQSALRRENGSFHDMVQKLPNC